MELESVFLPYIYQDTVFKWSDPDFASKEVSAPTNSTYPTQPETTQVQEPKEITFWGQNKKKILLLVHEENDEYLNARDIDLLTTIIQSGLKLDKQDVALVNTAHWEATKIIAEIPWKNAIIFGTNIYPDHSGTPGEIITLDGKKVLFSLPVSSLHDNKANKILLWKGIKTMFKQ